MNTKLILSIIIVIVILLFYVFYKNESFISNNNVISMPIRSYYSTFMEDEYGKNSIVVGYHYTPWCGYCKLMKPIWEKLKIHLGRPEFSGIKLIENNEQTNPIKGINSYPTILKYYGGKARKYEGLADYNQLMRWVLTPTHVDTYGANW